MTFRVGQKVVCIIHWPDELRLPDAIYAEKDCVYTVRGFCPGTDAKTRLYLHEIHNKPMLSQACGLMEFGFRADYFRPLTERKTDISIFTKMLTPNKQKVRA